MLDPKLAAHTAFLFLLALSPLQFGQNTAGELGLGDTIERRTPTRSDFCLGKDVVLVTAGNEHTAILTNTGEVSEKTPPLAVIAAAGGVMVVGGGWRW